MKRILHTIAARLREPSTMAGLAGLAALAGMPAQLIDPTFQLAASLAGLAAILFPEQPPPPPSAP